MRIRAGGPLRTPPPRPPHRAPASLNTARGTAVAPGLPKRPGAAAVTASGKLQQVAFWRLRWREGPLEEGRLERAEGEVGSVPGVVERIPLSDCPWFSLPHYTKQTSPTLSACQRRKQRHLFEEIAAFKATCVLSGAWSGLVHLPGKVWA